MSSSLHLIIFILLFSTTIVFGDIEFHCQKHHKKNVESCSSLNLDQHKCIYTDFRYVRIPIPSQHEVPAKQPDYLDISYLNYTTKHNKSIIAANITWLQTPWKNKTSFEWPKGYAFSAQIDNFVFIEWLVCFKPPSITRRQNAHFNIITDKKNEFQPEEDYVFSIQPLPQYHDNTDMNDIISIFTVPGCKDKLMSVTDYCISEKKRKRKKRSKKKKMNKLDAIKKEKSTKEHEENLKQESTSMMLLYLFIPVASFALLSLFIAAGLYFKSRRNKGFDLSSLVILADLNEDLSAYHHASNLFVSMLGGGLTFNLWKRSNIDDRKLWLHQHLNNCKHVLLIVAPHKHGINNNSDDFMTDFNLYLERYPDRNFAITTVYFGSDREGFPKKVLSLGKSFQLPEQLDKCLRHISGKNLCWSGYATQVEKLRLKVNEIRNECGSSINLVLNVRETA